MARFMKSRPPATSAALLQRGCHSKRRYADESVARIIGTEMQKVNSVQLWVYLCQQCRGWHLTRNNNGAKMAVDHYTKEKNEN